MTDRSRLLACTSYLLDMDGTIYVDERIVPGALEFIDTLSRKGISALFLTNNSSADGEHYRVRLEKLGIRATRDQVFTSGDATIEFLLRETPHRSAYVVGTPALEEAFERAGISLSAPDPDCVVVGFDKTLTYAKLERACTLLFAGKPYYATHPDKTCITMHGLVPDIAAIISACEAVTGRTPIIVGKPNEPIVRAALSRLGARAETTAMVGDQLDTDMTMAARAGLCGVLVMSGETTPAKLAAWQEKPQFIAKDVAEITEWINEAKGAAAS